MREKLIDVFMHLDRHIENRDEYGICYTSDFAEAVETVLTMLKNQDANGVTVQQWIPVSERLPSKEEYTAKAEDGTEYYVRLLIAYKTDIVEYEIGYYDGYKWMTEMPIRIIKDVVAWMPFPNMPQPPKED